MSSYTEYLCQCGRYVRWWALNNSAWLMLCGFVVVLVLVMYVGARHVGGHEIAKELEFIEWCKAEYESNGYKDIDKYCFYLYRGKVK